MKAAAAVSLLLLLNGITVFAAGPPAARDVTLKAADGTSIKATYYAAGKPGPAVLLLHMCNTTRKSWEPLGPQLAAAGIHALAMDYRGFGESGGDRFDKLAPQDALNVVNGKWPGDVDVAYEFLLAQPGVDKARAGAAGGSCGVAQAVNVARRHHEVRSLVLLAGPADAQGMAFLDRSPWLPIFAAAAADDQYDPHFPELMEWIVALSGNPRNRFSGFSDGKHGTEIFGPHPELPTHIVDWYVDTLITRPAEPSASFTPKRTPMREFWQSARTAEGVAAAVKMFHDERARNPNAVLFPETAVNQLGYEYLRTAKNKEAIELFKLNAEAYPASANTYDSLGDAYLADGQNQLALQASRKALEVLPADTAPDARKQAVRTSAEQKIAKLTGR